MLWIGETTSSVGGAVSKLALPLVAITALHSGGLVLGVLHACAWAPWLVIGLFAGGWVDRLTRRPLMVTCDVAAALTLVSVPVAAWLGVLTTVQLIVVALLSGSATMLFNTAYTVYVPAIVAPEQLLEANGKLQSTRSAAQVAGPGAAGALAQTFGAVTGLLADAISFVVIRIWHLAQWCRRIGARSRPSHG